MNASYVSRSLEPVLTRAAAIEDPRGFLNLHPPPVILDEVQHAAQGPMGGAIFETAVVSEVVRSLTHQGTLPQVYFWRLQSGEEVDLIIDTPEGLVPIEVKLFETPKRAMAQGIRRLSQALGARARDGYLVNPGEARLPLGEGVRTLPFSEL